MKKIFVKTSLLVVTPFLLTSCGVSLFNFDPGLLFTSGKANTEIMQVGDYLTWDIFDTSNAYIIEGDKLNNDGTSEHFVSDLSRDNFVKVNTSDYLIDNVVIKYYNASTLTDISEASLLKTSEVTKIEKPVSKENPKVITHDDFYKKSEDAKDVYHYQISRDTDEVRFNNWNYDGYTFDIANRIEDLHIYLDASYLHSYIQADDHSSYAPVFNYLGKANFNCFFHLSRDSSLLAGKSCPALARMKNVIFVSESNGGVSIQAGSGGETDLNRPSVIDESSKLAIEANFILNTVSADSMSLGRVALIGGAGANAKDVNDGMMGNYPFSKDTRVAGIYKSLGVRAGDGGKGSYSTLYTKHYGGNAMSFEYMVANDLAKYKDYLFSAGVPNPGEGESSSSATGSAGKPGEVLYP